MKIGDKGVPLVSVIVPVYNVEQYLLQCLDSLFNQTLKEIEIILVNDGSTDNSRSLCEKYVELDNRFQLINKENGGLISAWKAGVENSSGQYIGFVDSDDWVEHDMFEKMFEKCIQFQAEVVCSGLIRELPDQTIYYQYALKDGFYSKEEMEKKIFPYWINNSKLEGRQIDPARVTKLFKRELIFNNLHYCNENTRIGEDFNITFPAILDAEGVYIMNHEYFYHYRLNPQSLLKNYSPDMWSQILNLNNALEKIYKDKNVFDFEAQVLQDLVFLTFLAIDNELNQNNKKNKREKIAALRDITRHERLMKALKLVEINKLNIKKKIVITLLKYQMAASLYLLLTFRNKNR